MYGKECYLALERVAETLGLADCVGDRNDYVAEHLCARVKICVIHSVFTKGEREHVGAPVHVAIFAVESVYLFVVHKADAYLGRIVKFLECQNRGACAAHEHSYSCRYFDLMLVVCDNYLNFASHFLFFTSSCFS